MVEKSKVLFMRIRTLLLIGLCILVLLLPRCVEGLTSLIGIDESGKMVSISEDQISSTEGVVCDQSTCTAPKPFSSISIGTWVMSEDSSGRLTIKKGTNSTSPYFRYNTQGVSVDATGTFTTSTSGSYVFYTFTGNGTIQCLTTETVNILIVGGGGGGHGCNTTAADEGGCGGGAGGLLHGTVTLTAGVTYTISVGAGGTGYIPSSNTAPTNGSNSTVSGTDVSITVYGGGSGGRGSSGTGVAGGQGGSGGGGSSAGAVRTALSSGNVGTVTSLGRTGGVSRDAAGQAGGGGATAAGGSSVSSSFTAGAGGAGYTWTVNARTYGGGGGGGTRSSGTVGAGGTGGGGSGSNSGNGVNGTINTGGGGGGGAGRVVSSGGSGGSGVVVIAFSNTGVSLAIA